MTPSTRATQRTPEEEENFQNDQQLTGEVSDQESNQGDQQEVESNVGSDAETSFTGEEASTEGGEIDDSSTGTVQPSTTTAPARPPSPHQQSKDPHSASLMELVREMQEDHRLEREEHRRDRREQAEERLLLKSTPQAAREDAFELKGSASNPKPPFDGLDSSKLRTFLTQCTLAFDGSPVKFKNDHNKVTYACMHLSGIAFAWYQTEAIKKTPPPWRDNWDLFQAKLQTRYGEANIAIAADKAIKLLKMANNSRLSEYESKFSVLVNDLSWSDSDAALRDQFRSGLCYRIRDKLGDIRPPPATLEEYIDTCFLIDNTYWEIHDERIALASTTRQSNQSTPAARNSFVPRQNHQPSSSSSSSSTTDKERKPFVKSSTPSAKTLNLDASGKLNATDRQYRLDNKLCLYCGSAGHAVDPSKDYSTPNDSYPHTSELVINLNIHTNHQSSNNQSKTKRDKSAAFIVPALIDSGASVSFITTRLVQKLHLSKSPLNHPVNVTIFDGSKIAARFGVAIEFSINDKSFPKTQFVQIDSLLGKHDVILGYDFLRQHQPHIDWKSNQLTFDSDTPELTLGEIPTTSSIDLLNDDTYVDLSTDDMQKALSVVPQCYHTYIDVFSKAKGESLPPHRQSDLKINLVEGAIPPHSGIYRLALPEQITLRNYLDDMLAKGLIRVSSSRAAAPVLFVPKGDRELKELRLCCDYRRLNNITIKDRYPLPSTNMLLDQLQTAKIYSKLDLRSAYHRIRIAEGDEWKTAFKSRYGLYEWLVMPFGLTNAPAAFQRLVNEILQEYIDIFVIVYLDDILIYSNNEAEHTGHVIKVLQRLRENFLYAKLEKCEFHVTSVQYLGFIITPAGISMDPKKVSTIMEWPQPSNIKAVRGFLGFANFYRRFIYNYSVIVVPLNNLQKKDVPFRWTDGCQTSFDNLKGQFITAPILGHFNPQSATTIETDASDYAMGAVFNQIGDDGLIHPIAFISRTLQPAEQNYDVFDKEMLAIFFAMVEWRPLLLSLQHQFTVLTDHRSLTYFMTTKSLTRRQVRWAERLAEYDFLITYRPGKDNTQADALSRREDIYPDDKLSFEDKNPENTRPFFQHNHVVQALVAAVTSSNYNSDDLAAFIRQSQASDQETLDKIDALSTTSTPPYSLRDGILLYDNRIFIPDNPDLRLQILQSRHDHPTAGHPGRTKTFQLVRRDFYWPGIQKYVSNYVRGCHPCNRAKPARHKPYGLLQPLVIAERPWSSLSMDFIDQLPLSDNFDSILVVVDRFTKMALFIPTRTDINSSELAVLFVQHIFSKHGVPADIVSDRGSKFTSSLWRDINKALGIHQSLSTTFHPQTDGQTERINQIVETYLRLCINYNQDNWSKYLPLAEFSYNNATHSSTTMSPFFANKGYHPTLEISLTGITLKANAVNISEIKNLHLHARQEIAKALKSNEHYANQHRIEPPPYAIGDKAWLSTKNLKTTRPTKKFSERRLGPFPIIQIISKLAVKLDLPAYLNGIHPVFHVSLLEPFHPDNTPNRIHDPPPPVIVANEIEYEVSRIQDSRYRYGRLYYLVEWLGYENNDAERVTWEVAENVLSGSPRHIKDYHDSHPRKPGPDLRKKR